MAKSKKTSTKSKAKEFAKTKQGRIVFGLCGLVLSYAFISRAFDTGSFGQYLCSIIFFGLGVSLLIRAFKK